MLVYISWGLTSLAEQLYKEQVAEHSRKSPPKTKSVALDDNLKKTIFDILPEYSQLLDRPTTIKLPPLFSEMLAMRIVVPAQQLVVTWQQALRPLNGEKPVVAVAAAEWLKSQIPTSADKHVTSFRDITFVGFSGLAGFLERWAYTCAESNVNLPFHFIRNCSKLELNPDLSRQLLSSSDVPAAQTPWPLAGASAIRDSEVLLVTANRLNLTSLS